MHTGLLKVSLCIAPNVAHQQIMMGGRNIPEECWAQTPRGFCTPPITNAAKVDAVSAFSFRVAFAQTCRRLSFSSQHMLKCLGRQCTTSWLDSQLKQHSRVLAVAFDMVAVLRVL
jgi:hypothetical protein